MNFHFKEYTSKYW